MARAGVGLQTSYDEVFASDGSVRPHYLAFREVLGIDPLRPPPQLVEVLGNRPLGDDSRILPFPWLLPAAEYESVRAGVAQRARALQRFFSDVALGSASFLGQSVALATILDEVLDLERTSAAGIRRQWDGHCREDVRFVYSPDLLHGPDGRWYVLEDNVGCVGGSADSHFVWNHYLRAASPGSSPVPDADSDLAHAVRRWMLAAGADGPVSALLGCEPAAADPRSPQLRENERRRVILEGLGIRVTEDCGPKGCGAVPGEEWPLLNFHTGSLLVEDRFRRRSPLFNAPATGILGNKALLPFVDDMIRFYCHEEPILATPTTLLMKDGGLPLEAHEWVVKSAAGCQGTEVFILRNESALRIRAIGDLVEHSCAKHGWVAQEYVRPSRIEPGGPGGGDSYLLELRPVTYVVGWNDVHVGRQPLGKAVPSTDLRGLHNVSQGAYYVPVTCVDPAGSGPRQPGGGPAW
jgi:hypothetical protein